MAYTHINSKYYYYWRSLALQELRILLVPLVSDRGARSPQDYHQYYYHHLYYNYHYHHHHHHFHLLPLRCRVVVRWQ